MPFIFVNFSIRSLPRNSLEANLSRGLRVFCPNNVFQVRTEILESKLYFLHSLSYQFISQGQIAFMQDALITLGIYLRNNISPVFHLSSKFLEVRFPFPLIIFL